MYNQPEMEQLIMSNPDVRLYLKLCYLDDIYDPKFQEELTEFCCRNHVNEERALAFYFSIWLPGDNDYDNMMKKINELAAKP